MKPQDSAALLAYHRDPKDADLRVFICHMGGPFWARKQERAWSIPKGEFQHGREDPLVAAQREFVEETGCAAPTGEALDLGVFVQGSGKRVRAFAMAADPSLCFVGSNDFLMEWPRGSGRMRGFPEMDAGGWFTLEHAAGLVVAGQAPILQALAAALDSGEVAEPQSSRPSPTRPSPI